MALLDRIAQLDQLGDKVLQRIEQGPYYGRDDVLSDRDELLGLLASIETTLVDNGWAADRRAAHAVTAQEHFQAGRDAALATQRVRNTCRMAQQAMYDQQQADLAAATATANPTAVGVHRLLPPPVPQEPATPSASNAAAPWDTPLSAGRTASPSWSAPGTSGRRATSGLAAGSTPTAAVVASHGGAPTTGALRVDPGGFAVPVGRGPRASPSPARPSSGPTGLPAALRPPESPFYLQSLVPQSPAASAWLHSAAPSPRVIPGAGSGVGSGAGTGVGTGAGSSGSHQGFGAAPPSPAFFQQHLSHTPTAAAAAAAAAGAGHMLPPKTPAYRR